MRAPGPNLRITKIVDPISKDAVAYGIVGPIGGGVRAIWLDGRPHPPDFAEHTWAGFSTGKWERDILIVTTTHQVFGCLKDNSVHASRSATMTEYFIRRGENNYLNQYYPLGAVFFCAGEPF